MRIRASDTSEHLAVYPVFSKNDGEVMQCLFVHHGRGVSQREEKMRVARLTL